MLRLHDQPTVKTPSTIPTANEWAKRLKAEENYNNLRDFLLRELLEMFVFESFALKPLAGLPVLDERCNKFADKFSVTDFSKVHMTKSTLKHFFQFLFYHCK